MLGVSGVYHSNRPIVVFSDEIMRKIEETSNATITDWYLTSTFSKFSVVTGGEVVEIRILQIPGGYIVHERTTSKS